MANAYTVVSQHYYTNGNLQFIHMVSTSTNVVNALDDLYDYINAVNNIEGRQAYAAGLRNVSVTNLKPFIDSLPSTNNSPEGDLKQGNYDIIAFFDTREE